MLSFVFLLFLFYFYLFYKSAGHTLLLLVYVEFFVLSCFLFLIHSFYLLLFVLFFLLVSVCMGAYGICVYVSSSRVKSSSYLVSFSGGL